jgi:hypothetical protein
MIKKIVFSLLAFNVFVLLNFSPVPPPMEDPSDVHSHGLGGWAFSSLDTST